MQTMEAIVATRDLPNSEKVIEYVVHELYTLFYGEKNANVSFPQKLF